MSSVEAEEASIASRYFETNYYYEELVILKQLLLSQWQNLVLLYSLTVATQRRTKEILEWESNRESSDSEANCMTTQPGRVA